MSFYRPGRLEVQVEISLPDENGRLQILQIHTNKMKENSFIAPDVNLQEIGMLNHLFFWLFEGKYIIWSPNFTSFFNFVSIILKVSKLIVKL